MHNDKDIAMQTILTQNIKTLMVWRKEYGSQGKLAKKGKISQGQISRIMSGESGATVATVHKIAKVFGLEAWQLLVANLDPEHLPVAHVLTPEEIALIDQIKQTARKLHGGKHNANNNCEGDKQ